MVRIVLVNLLNCEILYGVCKLIKIVFLFVSLVCFSNDFSVVDWFVLVIVNLGLLVKLFILFILIVFCFGDVFVVMIILVLFIFFKVEIGL